MKTIKSLREVERVSKRNITVDAYRNEIEKEAMMNWIAQQDYFAC